MVYKAGDEHDFTPSSAMHFINREAAVAIKTQAPKVAAPKTARQETAEKPTRKPRLSAAVKGSIK